MNKKEFVDSLIQTIEQLDMSDDDVCRELKVSSSTLEKWLKGSSAPHPNGRIVIIEMLKRRAAK